MTPLRPGARVAVVAPGGAVDPDRLAPGLALLREWGLEPLPGPNLHARHRWLAGSRAQRAADLLWALSAPGVDAVWFARGGSGTADLLTQLPWEALPAERPVIGFSDATALLVALAARGRGAVHGPVVSTLASSDPATRQALRELLLAGRPPPLPGRHLCGPRTPVEGPLVGGNLTVLASLCGTPSRLEAADAVLLLEDVDEAPYRVERSLGQLLAAEALRGVVGVAIGELTRCGEDPDLLAAMLTERLEPLGVPVLIDLPVGHGERNLPFLHGARVRLAFDRLDPLEGWEGAGRGGD